MNFTHGVLDKLSPDLTHAILSRCAGCDFAGLNLSGRDLRGVRLSGADMRNVNLENANLEGAQLHGCDFHGAILRGAKLSGASLDGSDLEGVNFTGADLRTVEMVGASARSAGFGGADLDGAILCGVATNVDVDDRGNRTVTHGMTVCTELAGATFTGAKMRNIQRCEGRNDESRSCSQVSAQTLRDVAHANLSGAVL